MKLSPRNDVKHERYSRALDHECGLEHGYRSSFRDKVKFCDIADVAPSKGSTLLAEIPFLALLVAPLLLDYSIPQTRLSFSADTRLKLEIPRWEKGCRLLSGENKTSNGESNRAQKSDATKGTTECEKKRYLPLRLATGHKI